MRELILEVGEHPGRIWMAIEVVVPRIICPWGFSSRSARRCLSSSTIPTICSAWARKTLPLSVSVTGWFRSTSCVLNSSSRLLIWAETAGCVRLSSSPALRKLMVLEMVINVSSWLIFMDCPPYGYRMVPPYICTNRESRSFPEGVCAHAGFQN